MSSPERGCVAAGHPLTAEAGAQVLREGGNAVEPPWGAMLASFAAEPLLTGLGAGGYMLVAGTAGSLRCWTSSWRPAREQDGSAAELQAIEVSFGDAAQASTSGRPPAGSTERRRACARRSSAGAPCRSRRSPHPRPRSRARVSR